MSLKSAILALLAGLQALCWSGSAVADQAMWTVTVPWTTGASEIYFEAQSERIIDACRDRPGGYIVFPTVIQAAHIVELDGHALVRFGDPAFETVRSYYGAPVLPCKHVLHGKVLAWKVYSFTRYFARVASFPAWQNGPSLVNFFHETINVIAAGAMIVLSLFCFVIFQNKISFRLSGSLVAACCVLAVYFLWSVPEFFNISISMQSTQKIADSAVWIGLSLFFYCLRLENLCSKYLHYGFCAVVALACWLIITGSNGDEMQTGTSLPFGFLLILSISVLMRIVMRTLKEQELNRRSVFQALSLGIFVFTCINDAAVIEGYYNGYMILSIGIVSGLVFFALSVNEHIIRTYQERDYLRLHLEEEVERKTQALENTLKTLRAAQSELIQNEKLASLGTLSAGIAHEINNSLNYVNGSVKPLVRIIEKMDDPGKNKALKLLDVMRDGLKLTFDIIDSLRSYTGLNQAKIKSMPVKKLVQGVLTLLNQRLASVAVELDIDDRLQINTNLVALQQILMNLISNALDAMKNKGKLSIFSYDQENSISIGVADNGSGIPREIRDKIFDPFFTTKDVGEGTGIGLHIVRNEIEKLHGTIEFESEEGTGTTFIISLPSIACEQEEVACEAATDP